MIVCAGVGVSGGGGGHLWERTEKHPGAEDNLLSFIIHLMILSLFPFFLAVPVQKVS